MIIIGEKLNGSIPAVAKAIAEKDEAFIRERAKLQAEAGATFLDVCASVEEAVEVETLVWMICQIQGVTDVPICIDSPSAQTCVRAMPFCRKPGLINSVSLEGNKIDTIFPVIADTEWQCVALLCDSDGIPDSVEKRMDVFHGIMAKAKEYGIAPSRLHIDPLVVTLSTDQTALLVFAECCRRIKAEYPDIHITSGLSNISYGLPTRKNINYAFMTLAMEAGMDSAIVDPTNQQMLGIIYATNALLGRDEFCLEYINNCRAQGTAPAPKQTSVEMAAPKSASKGQPAQDGGDIRAAKLRAVAEAVENGKNKAVKVCVQEAIDAGVPPKDILNVGMIEAMDVVGDRFQKQIIFVPQMLAAARAMKSGVEVLKPHLSEGGGGSVGKMILGTVAGDFHDIGKNLVGMMIESAGVEVIDLGVDVPISTFIREIENHPDVTIVGLSALLTTTMPSLRDTVAALKEQPFASRIKIMVGGAPISQAFADEIGADAYTPDAASAAKKAKELALETRGLAGVPAPEQGSAEQAQVETAKADAPAEAQPEKQTKVETPAEPAKQAFDFTRLNEIMAMPAPVQDLTRSKYYDHWAETRQKWINYWKHQNTGRPVMTVIARKPEVEALSNGEPQDGGYLGQICQGNYYGLPEELMWKDMEDKYQNPERIVARYRQFCETHAFLAESFPNLNIDFGPGSLASYLGSDIGFKEDTVWFMPCFTDGWEHAPELVFNPENAWLLKHLYLAKVCRQLAGDDFFVDMPDLMENIDTLASLRGAQDTLYDLLDEPEEIEKRVKQIDRIYYEYYNRFYDIIKDHEGGNAYTVFQIWGPGKTVKLQCDFSAMMSPDDFRAYVQPSLRQQAEKADCVLYHLDGPDAIKHMDALMEIEGIDALQWTSGDAGPDGTLPDWDVIYDKAILAGKSIWVKVYSGDFEDWLKNVDRVVQKYGSHSLYLMFPEMSMEQAERLLAYADAHWSDVKGTFCVEHGLR